MILWFSPKFENSVKRPQSATKPKKTAESSIGIEEKLTALENLQALLGSGAISQEEFEAKKKQLLGL